MTMLAEREAPTAEDLVVLGGGLKRRRLAQHLTQKELADLAELDQPGVSRAEQGRGHPETFKRMDYALTTVEQEGAAICDHAEAFWKAVGRAPHRSKVLGELEAVIAVLDCDHLQYARLALRLKQLLPAGRRGPGSSER